MDLNSYIAYGPWVTFMALMLCPVSWLTETETSQLAEEMVSDLRKDCSCLGVYWELSWSCWLAPFCVPMYKVQKYRISSNKRPGAYFLHGLQTPEVKRDRRLFEARRLFLVAYFEGTVNLRRSLIEAHLRGLWALSPGDLGPRQRWPSFALREYLFRSGRVVFLHFTLQNTIVRWKSSSIFLTNWSVTNGR